MLRALYSAASGMQAQQMNLDVIANNLANVNTAGYKKTKIEFQDLLHETTRAAGAEQGGGNQLPTSLEVGQGSRPVSTTRVFTTGEISNTGADLDLAITGDGFFQVQMADGSLAYTRDGALKKASDGRIVTNEGLPLQGGFQAVPAGTTNITIASDGSVTYTNPNGNTNFRIQIARFANPSGLVSMGHNLYRESAASGTSELGNPGENGFGEMQQGALELSNVKVVEEMVNLILAQRAYEVNSKAVQAADEMMQQSNNLRR